MLSVIVPVYCCEKYLAKCVDSICNQTYKDLEIILVDDGSLDNSSEICDELSNNDSRIKVIHKENGGVSSARNAGLDIATGDYITFVDSDDYIENVMYAEMLSVAEKYNCDIVMCDCIKECKNYTELYSHNIREGFYSYEQLKREYYPHLLMMENIEYPATISNWVMFFKADICLTRYIEGVRFSEDLLFGAQLMYNAKSFYYMKGKTYYHYVMNEQSASHKFTKDKWCDYKQLFNEAEKFFLNRKDYSFQHQLDLMLLFLVYNSVGNISGYRGSSYKEKKN